MCEWADKIDVPRGNSNFSLLRRVGRRPAVIGFSSTSLHHNNNLILASVTHTHTSSLPPASAALQTPVLSLFEHTHTSRPLRHSSRLFAVFFSTPPFVFFNSLFASPLYLSLIFLISIHRSTLSIPSLSVYLSLISPRLSPPCLLLFCSSFPLFSSIYSHAT